MRTLALSQRSTTTAVLGALIVGWMAFRAELRDQMMIRVSKRITVYETVYEMYVCWISLLVSYPRTPN